MDNTKLIEFFKTKRNDFPVLKRKVNGHNLIYFDNSATALKPKKVIDAVSDFYSNYTSNVHRGIHSLSEEATEKYDDVRVKIAKLINAKSENEIVFTKGSTESLNLVAFGLMNILNEGDEIVITQMEHHANLVQWQEIAKLKKAKLKYIKIDENFRLDLTNLDSIITNKTKIVSLTHYSNVLGTINPIKEIIEFAHKKGALTIVDGAQSIPHKKIDVRDLNCDFFAFSSHKMCGPSGVGVLYGKYDLLKKLEPREFGGSMIYEVDFENATYNEVPYKFEAGTPNIEGVIGLGAAIDYLNEIGMENVEKYEQILIEHFLKRVLEVENVILYGPKDSKNRGGVFSFNIKGIHPHDISTIFDNYGIAIRGGHHCAMPLITKMDTCATSRISIYFYNTIEEIDYAINVMKKLKEEFDKGEFLLK